MSEAAHPVGLKGFKARGYDYFPKDRISNMRDEIVALSGYATEDMSENLAKETENLVQECERHRATHLREVAEREEVEAEGFGWGDAGDTELTVCHSKLRVLWWQLLEIFPESSCIFFIFCRRRRIAHPRGVVSRGHLRPQRFVVWAPVGGQP